MVKLYLLGGENVCRRSAKEVNERAFLDAQKPLNVLVFPWARGSFDKRYRRRKKLADYFRSLGADNVEFVEYGEKEGIAEKMAEAGVIYLTGGQPSILIERIRKMELDRLFIDYKGIIVGRSAGALALCKRCVTTCKSNSKVRVVDGINLIDITLKAHYIPKNDEVLKRFSLKERIFAVPKDSALIYDNGALSALGNVYLFNGGERRVFHKAEL